MLKKSNKSKCNFCDQNATKEVLTEIEIMSGQLLKLPLCTACYKSYVTGNKFGQLQVHSNILSLILNADDEASVLSLKEKISEVAPLS